LFFSCNIIFIFLHNYCFSAYKKGQISFPFAPFSQIICSVLYAPQLLKTAECGSVISGISFLHNHGFTAYKYHIIFIC
jgi:hypothetical protein